jgi:hypothetical protein
MTENTNWNLSLEENWAESWKKAATFDKHAQNYPKWYKQHLADYPHLTGDFTTDFGVTREMLAAAYMEDHCPSCRRAYASMVHDRGRDTRIPRWWQTFHITVLPFAGYRWKVRAKAATLKRTIG